MKIKNLILSMATVGVLASCTAYDTPAAIAAGTVKEDSVKVKLSRHVLWVNIDGGVGSLVKEMTESGELPVIKDMLQYSKYSWTGLADNRRGVSAQGSSSTGEDPVTWASMLTGVSSDLHFIHDGSYLSDYKVGNNPLAQTVSNFPSIVNQVNNGNADMTVSCVTPFGNLTHYLADAESAITTDNDSETQTELLNQLKTKDYSLIITSFRGVLDAGRSGGFKLENTDYKSALKQVDTYLSELQQAINSRTHADMEDWLIVVSSNIGGTPEGLTGGTSDSERDIFGLFYNPHYTSYEIKGGTITAPLFCADADFYAEIRDTTALYEIKDGTIAVEFNLRLIPRSDGLFTSSWRKVLGKTTWGIFRERSQTKIRINSNPVLQEDVTGSNDCLWHSYYFHIGDRERATRSYQMSYDGARVKANTVQAGIGLKPDSTFFYVGKEQVSTNYYIASIRLWNTALDDPTVDAYKGVYTAVPKSHPQYKHLIGEWVLTPENVIGDSVINNSVPGMPQLYLTKKPVFIKTANTLPDRLASNSIMMENTLIAPQIVYWLLGASSIDPRLEGYNFLKSYAIEEQWRDKVE